MARGDSVSWVEYLWPVSFTVVLLASCLIDSGKRHYWLDELLTRLVVTDGDFQHMLAALADQINTTPPLYFLVAWGWAQVFGGSALSLRLLSSLCVCEAFFLLWVLLRRHFSLWATLFGGVGCLALCRELAYQNQEARFYGFFLLLCATALTLYDRLFHTDRPSLRLPFGIALVTAALVLTHLFGFLYSFALAVAAVLARQLPWATRWRVVLATAFGWLAFLPWVPVFLWHIDIGKPSFWIPVPSFSDLVVGLFGTIHLFALVGVAVVVAAAHSRGRLHRFFPALVRDAGRLAGSAHLITAGCLLALLVPVLAFAVSRVMTSIFLPRYLLPGVLGWAVLMAAVGELLWVRATAFSQGPASRLGRGLTATLTWGPLAIVTLFPLAEAALRPPVQPRWLEEGEPLFPDLPVVFVTPHTYVPAFFYTPERKPVYVLDWEATLESPRPQTYDYKLMVALKRQYPEHQVVDGATFLAQHDRFLVLDEPDQAWLERRVASSPEHRVTPLRGAWFLVERSRPAGTAK